MQMDEPQSPELIAAPVPETAAPPAHAPAAHVTPLFESPVTLTASTSA
jgi:hypothetical protein